MKNKTSIEFLLFFLFIVLYNPCYSSKDTHLELLNSKLSETYKNSYISYITIRFKHDEEEDVISYNFEDTPAQLFFNGSNYTLDEFLSIKETLEVGDDYYLTFIWNKAVTDCSSMFLRCKSIEEIDLSHFDSSEVTDMTSMFFDCINLTSIDVSKFITSKVTNMEELFGECVSLTSLDLSNFDTSQVTNMDKMFSTCTALESLNISSFDTSKVLSMNSLFYGCISLTSFDLSNFDTSQVTDLSGMFSYCYSLESLDLSNFDTSNVESLYLMFYECHSITSIDLSSFDTSKVTVFSNIFNNCSSLLSINLSNFDTSNAKIMGSMFFNCSSLTNLDLSSFNTSKAEDFAGMFYGCKSLESLNLSNFNTFNIKYMNSMFEGCSSLKILNLSSFNTTKVKEYDDMFTNCSSLAILDISNFYLKSEKDLFSNLKNLLYINLFYFKGNVPNIDHAVTYCADNSENKDQIISILSKINSINDCSNKCFKESNKFIEDLGICLNCKENNKYFNYDKTDCIDDIPDGYFLNDSNLNTIDKCHPNCKTCDKKEEGNNNNCNECISNYRFMSDSIYINNCYEICQVYYYYDSSNEYNCCDECPTDYKLILEKKKCIEDCNKDDTYKYEYNGNCYDSPYSSNENTLSLLFVDNYTFNEVVDEVLFNIYLVFNESEGGYPKTINFTMNVSYLDRLRILSSALEKFICYFFEKNNNLLKYLCGGKVKGKIDTITPNYDFELDGRNKITVTEFGKNNFNHLKENTGSKYSSSEIIILEDSKFSQDDQNTFTIKGKIDENKKEFDNVILKLYDTETGEEKNAFCNSINKDANNYELKCSINQYLVASMNNALGEIQDENTKYLLIKIKKGNNELLSIINPEKFFDSIIRFCAGFFLFDGILKNVISYAIILIIIAIFSKVVLF